MVNFNSDHTLCVQQMIQYEIENIHRGRKVLIPQQHTQTFIAESAISYFLSINEELLSFSYEKAHPITEELNLFFWMANSQTYDK